MSYSVWLSSSECGSGVKVCHRRLTCGDAAERRAAEEGEHFAAQEGVHDDATAKRTQQSHAVRAWRTSHQLQRMNFYYIHVYIVCIMLLWQ